MNNCSMKIKGIYLGDKRVERLLMGDYEIFPDSSRKRRKIGRIVIDDDFPESVHESSIEQQIQDYTIKIIENERNNQDSDQPLEELSEEEKAFRQELFDDLFG